MKKRDVNRLIVDQVDEIDDAKQKKFIKEILQFEREHLDLDQPHYKETYRDLIEEYATE